MKKFKTKTEEHQMMEDQMTLIDKANADGLITELWIMDLGNQIIPEIGPSKENIIWQNKEEKIDKDSIESFYQTLPAAKLSLKVLSLFATFQDFNSDLLNIPDSFKEHKEDILKKAMLSYNKVKMGFFNGDLTLDNKEKNINIPFEAGKVFPNETKPLFEFNDNKNPVFYMNYEMGNFNINGKIYTCKNKQFAFVWSAVLNLRYKIY